MLVALFNALPDSHRPDRGDHPAAHGGGIRRGRLSGTPQTSDKFTGSMRFSQDQIWLRYHLAIWPHGPTRPNNAGNRRIIMRLAALSGTPWS
ncbi:hypothetical protein [Novosphingobium sp.]|uniref:hypothetical protein n=1 Tax=Novosphingobium sp. TaxID=1874826 RepID=UPI0031DEE0C1